MEVLAAIFPTASGAVRSAMQPEKQRVGSRDAVTVVTADGDGIGVAELCITLGLNVGTIYGLFEADFIR